MQRYIYCLVLVSVCSPALAQSTGLGLEAFWSFDEGARETAADSSANGYDGDIVGATWTNDTGDLSPFALAFDGALDRVDVGGWDVPGSELSMAAWFYIESFANADGRLISKASGVGEQQHHWMLSTTDASGAARLRFRLKAGGTTSTLVADSGDLAAGQWMHAAAVYGGGSMRLYLDGDEVGSLAKSGSLDNGPGVMVAIGRQPIDAGAQGFHGRIDDVRVYGRALSPSEIDALANPNVVPPITPSKVPPLSASFAEPGQEASEAGGVVTAEIRLLFPSMEDVTIDFALGGTAVSGVDYMAGPNPVTIPAGSTSGGITVTPVDDGDEESTETIELSLVSATNAVLSGVLSHSITLFDDDATAFPISDDFNANNLQTALWTFVDPLGDSTLEIAGAGTADAQLSISVPAGVAHEAWTPNEAPRVMQSVPDGDFDVVVKFESQLTERYQNDGLIVEQDAGTWLRFDFRYDGANLQAYASETLASSPQTLGAVNIAAGPWLNPTPLYLRVQRVGDVWTYFYSFDGAAWLSAVTFSRAITVSAVGPFCGNAGAADPAHTTVIDYVFSMSAPILPEDGSPPPADTVPPLLYRFAGRPLNSDLVEVEWGTDEPASAVIEYGETDSYELGVWGAFPTLYAGSTLVSGLEADTTYYFRATVADVLRNESVVEGLQVTTFPEGFTGEPIIDVWYADAVPSGAVELSFGALGKPQRWVNVLGNVQDLDGTVQALSYRLNGGPEQPLSMGTTERLPWRLDEPGDFNVEIDADDLDPGPNTVLVIATDDELNVGSEVVELDYTPGTVWPLPYSIDWDVAPEIADVAQVVDGLWAIEPNPLLPAENVLRVKQMGYDRLVDVGDVTWEDYEITVPMTVHQLDPNGFTPGSNSYAAGILLRWTGHTDAPPVQQPRAGFFPFGGVFVYRWFPDMEVWQHYGTDFIPTINSLVNPLQLGVEYTLRGEVTTLFDGRRQYRFKAWPAGQAEPATWMIDALHDPGTGNPTGSVLLLAHHADVAFGDVQIVPIPAR